MDGQNSALAAVWRPSCCRKASCVQLFPIHHQLMSVPCLIPVTSRSVPGGLKDGALMEEPQVPSLPLLFLCWWTMGRFLPFLHLSFSHLSEQRGIAGCSALGDLEMSSTNKSWAFLLRLCIDVSKLTATPLHWLRTLLLLPLFIWPFFNFGKHI